MIDRKMDTKQQVLVELIKLKLYLLGQLASHHMSIHPQDVIEQINSTIEKVENIE